MSFISGERPSILMQIFHESLHSKVQEAGKTDSVSRGVKSTSLLEVLSRRNFQPGSSRS